MENQEYKVNYESYDKQLEEDFKEQHSCIRFLVITFILSVILEAIALVIIKALTSTT